MRLNQLCEHYRDSRIELRDNSFEQITVAVRLFSRWLGRPAELADLTKGNLVSWMRWLKSEGRAGRTVNGKRSHILSLWNFAADEGLFTPPPRRIPRANENTRQPVAWLEDEVNQMLAVAPQATPRRGWGHREWVATILICWDTALRIGTVLRLEAGSFSVDSAGRGWINTPAAIQKGKRATLHRVHADTVQAIETMQAESVIEDTRKLLRWPYPIRDIQRHFANEILRPAGLLRPGAPRFHAFRKASYSYAMAAEGKDAAGRHAAHTSDLSKNYADPRIVQTWDLVDRLPRPIVA